VLHTVKEEKNILHTRNKGTLTALVIYFERNFVLKHVLGGKLDRIEMTERPGRTVNN
jgi:hypothetical protein